LVEIDKAQVAVEAVKAAEDSNAVIVRLYEAWGGRCTARVRTALGGSRPTSCDLLERNLQGQFQLHQSVAKRNP